MTRSPSPIVRALVAAAAGLLLLGACGGVDEAGGGGSVVIDGSSTVAPISEAVAEEFRAERGDAVEVSVGTSGTGGGFKKFCAGEIDIADASRPIKAEEVAACEAGGIGFTELRVGLDGLAIVTSAENEFLDCLTLDQLALIFKDGGATTWDQVDPGFPAEPIAIFAPGTDSGTYDFFVEEVLGAPGEEGSLAARTDHTASEDDNTLVQGIKGERNSWGFFGYAYYSENDDVVRAVEVAGEGGTCVAPSNRTVASGDYPLSRPLFIYVKRSALARPAVQEFVGFYLEITPELITDVGYSPAPAEDYEKGRSQLDATG